MSTMNSKILAATEKACLINRLKSGVWGMRPDAIHAMVSKLRMAIVEDQPKRLEPTVAEASACPEAAKLDVARSAGAVVVLPIRGVIEQHRSWYADVFVDEMQSMLERLVSDDSIGSIVLQWDSPGGVVFGVPELAETIRAYRSVKPIYSLADAEMYSAAYWLGSAATKTFVIPSGGVGSVGVWTAHTDYSKAYEDLGIKVTLISSTPEKVEGNPWEPLSEDAREAMQADVDKYYGMFVDSVAKNRGISSAAVKKNFGGGRTVMAKDAMESGMVDGIATLTDLLGAIVPCKRGSARATAEAQIMLAEIGE